MSNCYGTAEQRNFRGKRQFLSQVTVSCQSSKNAKSLSARAFDTNLNVLTLVLFIHLRYVKRRLQHLTSYLPMTTPVRRRIWKEPVTAEFETQVGTTGKTEGNHDKARHDSRT